MNILLLIVIGIVIIYYQNNQIENFKNKSKFKLNQQLRDHLYLEFLERLNNSYQSKIKGNTKGPFKVICDDNKNKSITITALTEAFDKVPSTNPITQETMRQLISKDPVIFKSQMDTDTCIHKADLLCQHTNPGNYINITTKTYPSRQSKSSKLSKITDLNCWNKMYSCCIKKL